MTVAMTIVAMMTAMMRGGGMIGTTIDGEMIADETTEVSLLTSIMRFFAYLFVAFVH